MYTAYVNITWQDCKWSNLTMNWILLPLITIPYCMFLIVFDAAGIVHVSSDRSFEIGLSMPLSMKERCCNVKKYWIMSTLKRRPSSCFLFYTVLVIKLVLKRSNNSVVTYLRIRAVYNTKKIAQNQYYARLTPKIYELESFK